MRSDEVRDQKSLEGFLANSWMVVSKALAFRAALRILPNVQVQETGRFPVEAVVLFRGLIVVSMKLHDYYENIEDAIGSANAAFHDPGLANSYHGFGSAWAGIAAALESVAHDNQPHSWAAIATQNCVGFMSETIWEDVRSDLKILESAHAKEPATPATTVMLKTPLWRAPPGGNWESIWYKIPPKLRRFDPNFSVWTDWFERRVKGEFAAFDIPGDKDRTEDKAILRRLAAATDGGFWGKGYKFVNAELTRWLEEARARVGPPQPEMIYVPDERVFSIADAGPDIPLQDPSATTYGINQQGQLDRLPPTDQAHLRDVPNQRRSYADLRAAVMGLLQEGQRLGPRLQPRLERFGQSLPEDFERAEAYLVWRDGIALRRLYRAHLAVAKGKDPDPARLEPAAAEGLGEVLDLYNPFAFADDGIRAKDEATIAPQERASVEAEAAAAAPLVTAVLGMPEIATAAALGDIAADAEDAELPGDDPYAAQARAQANLASRNRFSALILGVSAVLTESDILKGIVINAAWDGIKLTANAVGMVNYAPILQFIAAEAANLQHYVALAFPHYEHLPDLIARIKAAWDRWAGKDRH